MARSVIVAVATIAGATIGTSYAQNWADERGFIFLEPPPAFYALCRRSGGYHYQIKSGELVLSNDIAVVGRSKIAADGSFSIDAWPIQAKGNLTGSRSISVWANRGDCKYTGVFAPAGSPPPQPGFGAPPPTAEQQSAQTAISAEYDGTYAGRLRCFPRMETIPWDFLVKQNKLRFAFAFFSVARSCTIEIQQDGAFNNQTCEAPTSGKISGDKLSMQIKVPELYCDVEATRVRR